IRHTEFLSDLPQVARCGLVPLHILSTDDFKIVDFGQAIDNFLLYAVGEAGILLGAQVLERQYRDSLLTDNGRLLFRRLRCLRSTSGSVEVPIQKNCCADYNCCENDRTVHRPNETEISHGRVSWQTRRSYFAMEPRAACSCLRWLASSIGQV